MIGSPTLGGALMGEFESSCGRHQLNALKSFPPHVIVVSPVLLYREGLAASLLADGRLQVVAITDPSHSLSEVLAHNPQAVLFDANGEGALAMARKLKSLDRDFVLVGFGISNSASQAIACAEAGLSGFIDESGSIDALVKTTIGALQGEFRTSPKVTALLCERLASLANGARARGPIGSPSLSPREREIASLVSEGLSNKEIAIDLHIGPATVKNHVHNILDKLGVRRRAAIAARVSAMQH